MLTHVCVDGLEDCPDSIGIAADDGRPACCNILQRKLLADGENPNLAMFPYINYKWALS